MARLTALLLVAIVAACARSGAPASTATRPSILLVTLDTTRADSIGPEAAGRVRSPAFDALAARGRRYAFAYATAPETLPSHASILSGLYPAGHGVHENARRVPDRVALVSEELRTAGYATSAFVSSFVLSKRFGLARGFDSYDDDLGGANERSAAATTERAVASLSRADSRPRFVWVHYFDPHAPYEPPEPYRTRHAASPYLGEVEAMDEQLGRLTEAFAKAAGPDGVVIVAGDHGEGLGDHGEAQHGTLLYQSTMRVPLVVAGGGFEPGVETAPVSVRRIAHTIRDVAGFAREQSLRTAGTDAVLGEAMKPFLNYGWQPQVMAVDGWSKVILAGRIEAYDVARDPREERDLAEQPAVSRRARDAARDYPPPAASGADAASSALSADDLRRLASLGYVSGSARPSLRPEAPRPADMIHLLPAIERASGLFVAERYREAVPVLADILKADATNLDAALRLATAYSSLGDDARARAAFDRAASIAPDSDDVRVYRALHDAKGARYLDAVPALERSVQRNPERLPAVEALARIRERQALIPEALELWSRVSAARALSRTENERVGALAMSIGRTEPAIAAFEAARRAGAGAFGKDLELGVLYLAARRFDDARDALDRALATGRDRPMALFKRAQASVLLNEPDAAARITLARREADGVTRPLIERERLFAGK